jgi:hypothetical protein
MRGGECDMIIKILIIYTDMYSIDYEIFFHSGTIKQQQQAEQYAIQQKLQLPKHSKPSVACYEMTNTPEWQKSVTGMIK